MNENRIKTVGRVALLMAVAGTSVGCKGGSPAEKLVKDYLSQEKCADRAQFVLDAEANKPRMEKKYAENSTCKAKFESIEAAGCADAAVGDYCTVSAKKVASFCVKRVADKEYKIDWPCSQGWNDTPLVKLQAERSAPVALRAEVKLGTTYGGYFREKKDEYAALVIADDSSAYGDAYVRRDSPVGKELLGLLDAGTKRKLTLVVGHPNKTKETAEVEVIGLLRSDWRTFTPEEEATIGELAEKYLKPGKKESEALQKCLDAFKLPADDKILSYQLKADELHVIELMMDEDAPRSLERYLSNIRDLAARQDPPIPVPKECAAKK